MEAGVNIVDRGALPFPDLVAPTGYRTDLRPRLDRQIEECSPKMESVKSLFGTVAILFLFGNSCSNID
jgi:hypothetical protein